MAENKWVTQKELAKELKVSKQVIQNWIRREKLKWKLLYGIRLVDRTSAPKKKIK